MTNLCEFVPPSFTLPIFHSKVTDQITLVFVKDGRSIEIKYVNKESSSRMWIHAVCGLLPVDHINTI